MIIFKVLLGIIIIVLYIIFKRLLNETQGRYKVLYISVGLGVFTTIWILLWALNIAKYNTIIYYPIIELFK